MYVHVNGRSIYLPPSSTPGAVWLAIYSPDLAYSASLSDPRRS